MTPALIATVAGATFGMALFGSLVAWILRKIRPMPQAKSYALGIAVMLPIAITSSVYNRPGADLISSFAIYAVAAVLAYFLLVKAMRRGAPGS